MIESIPTTKCCDETGADCCTSEPTSSACCETTIESCCPPSTLSKSPSFQSSIVKFISLISLFLVSDYWLASFIEVHLSGFSARTTSAIAFFVSHSLGLLALLGSITTLAVFARSFIDQEHVRHRMSKINTVKGHGLAAAIGVATPFCSCSAVPVFTGFVRSGIPVSQAISFLVASPLVNEVAIFMLAAWSGWVIAGAYAATGFAIAVLAGIALRKYATPDLTEVRPAQMLQMLDSTGNPVKPSLALRASTALQEARETIKTTWVFVLIGVGFGALIHGWVPTTAIASIVSWGPALGVLGATALGIPLYSGIATVIPIISALQEKGMPTGTLLAFAMSVTALSLPEAMLLRKVMKPKLLFLYFATVAIGIVVVGVGFNLVIS